ncbi:MAG: class I SAM-dependent methyltransferase [Halobacteriota archaeon]|nr:class I SAM-dependent methyltransferase [Halobacteriota archaeon]
MSVVERLERLFEDTAARTNVHAHYLKKHINEFSLNIGHNSFVLDIGCGKSPYKHILDFERYISIDINKARDEDMVGDICNLPIKGNVVDLIVCTEVVEHVEDVDAALEELNRVLKREGYLILTMPLLMGVHDPVDFYRFTELGSNVLLKRCGFEVIKMKKRGGIFASIGAIVSKVPYQVFAPYDDRRNYPKYGILFLLYLLLIPLTKFFIAIDVFDKSKNYTLGYDVLCNKSI